MRRCVGVFDENLLNYQVVRISVMWGGAVASGLVRSTPDRVVRVRALAGVIVLCSLARHFTLTVLLFIQVCKWLLASHPGGSSSFMLRKPELSTEISVRRYFPRLDYQPLFRLTPKVMTVLPYMSIKWEDMENDVLGFPDLFDRQRDILFTGSPLFYVNSFFFFLHACFYCFSWFETSHGYTCFICKYISVPIKHSFKQPRC